MHPITTQSRPVLAITLALLSALGALLALPLALEATPAPAAASAWSEPTDAKQRPAPPSLPREFRAAWVATVANIDWPSAKNLTTEQQQAEVRAIIASARRLNLNALVLQVRPTCDAIYPSTLEPWSEFLTGASGKPPSPAYDPLAYWIAQAHEAGIEIHAWVNPFRARHIRSTTPDAADHIAKRRPDLVRSYDGYLWLDPGEPDAQDHSMRVIADLLTRYNLDGLHIDDYFYPYPDRERRPFSDDAPYARHVDRAKAEGRAPLERAAWRRDNIDRFVKRFVDETRRIKPHVKIGISPFGIWRPGFPPGIQGFDAYESLAADARRWLREGWLDYVAPQLYWPVDQRAQSFERLLDWWIANNDQRRHVWVGHNASRVLPADPITPGSTPNRDSRGRDSWEAPEVLRQIELTRARALGPGGSSGSILFSMKPLLNNHRGLADALANGPWKSPALVPATPWLSAGRPAPRKPSARVSASPNGEMLTISPPPPSTGGPGPLDTASFALWTRAAGQWTLRVVSAHDAREALTLPPGADALVLVAIDRVGREGEALTLVK
jgi:uncharacterized lipoprotein YddW (UPF0748 family)